MATLWITEYETLAPIDHGIFAQCGYEDGGTTRQKITYTTSTASTAFQDETRFIRVMADAFAHLEFATSPTATTSDHPIQANVEYWFGVIGGQKVAAYDGSS